MDIGVAHGRIRGGDARTQASRGAVGEGDAGRDCAYHEAGAVAVLNRFGIGHGDPAQHQ